MTRHEIEQLAVEAAQAIVVNVGILWQARELITASVFEDAPAAVDIEIASIISHGAAELSNLSEKLEDPDD